MFDPATIAVISLRDDLRRRRQAAMMPRLWLGMRDAWQRTRDRMSSAGNPLSLPRPRTGRRIACQSR